MFRCPPKEQSSVGKSGIQSNQLNWFSMQAYSVVIVYFWKEFRQNYVNKTLSSFVSDCNFSRMWCQPISALLCAITWMPFLPRWIEDEFKKLLEDIIAGISVATLGMPEILWIRTPISPSTQSGIVTTGWHNFQDLLQT